MPIHDFVCLTCGTDHPRRLWREGTPSLCECGSELDRVTTIPVIAKGCNYSAAGVTYGVQNGQRFHSTAERRAYENKHEITGVHDPSVGRGKELREESLHQADEAAREQGYNSHREYRASKAHVRALERESLQSFEKKIQV